MKNIIWCSIVLTFQLVPVISLEVALLQEDGSFSNNSFLRRSDRIVKPLKDFTLCARLSLNYLRGERNHWLTIGNGSKNNMIIGYLSNGKDGPRITVEKYHPKIKDQISIKFDQKFDYQNWHHFCFMFTSQAQFPYPGGYVNLTNKGYLDGRLVSTVAKTIIKSEYQAIETKLTTMLGQKGPNFDPKESFAGRYSGLTLWRGELDEKIVERLAKCKSVKTRGVILDWKISRYDGNEVGVVEIPRADLCKPYILADTSVFNHGISHDGVKLACSKLGGQLPAFENAGYRQLSDLFSKAVKDVKCKSSEYVNTDDIEAVTNLLNLTEGQDIRQGDTYFWTGIVEGQNQVLVNEYTQKPIDYDPNIWPGPRNV